MCDVLGPPQLVCAFQRYDVYRLVESLCPPFIDCTIAWLLDDVSCQLMILFHWFLSGFFVWDFRSNES